MIEKLLIKKSSHGYRKTKIEMVSSADKETIVESETGVITTNICQNTNKLK